MTLGQTATFTVVATGAAPLSYQWQRNGNNISGATSSSYTTPPTTILDDGALYTVVVDNSVDPITSSAAMLTVNLTTTVDVTTYHNDKLPPAKPRRNDPHAGERQFGHVRLILVPSCRWADRRPAALPLECGYSRCRDAQRNLRRHRE